VLTCGPQAMMDGKRASTLFLWLAGTQSEGDGGNTLWPICGPKDGANLTLLAALLVHLALPAIPEGSCPGVAPTPTPTAIPSPMPEPSATPLPSVWRCPEDTEGAAYVASDESDIFHCLDCEWAEKISPKSRLCFASYEAAVSAGFRSCQVREPP